MITRALAYASQTHTEGDVDAAVARGEMQRWNGDESTIITEILQTPQRKILNLFLAEGNLRELEALLPPVLEWARSVGCTQATFTGRFGWQRSFVRKFGFKESAIMMDAPL